MGHFPAQGRCRGPSAVTYAIGLSIVPPTEASDLIMKIGESTTNEISRGCRTTLMQIKWELYTWRGFVCAYDKQGSNTYETVHGERHEATRGRLERRVRLQIGHQWHTRKDPRVRNPSAFPFQSSSSSSQSPFLRRRKRNNVSVK